MKTSVLALSLLGVCASAAFSQATSTASRAFDLQAGGGFVYDKSDYGSSAYKGGALYTTLDFKPHFGVEFDFREAKASYDAEYEKTYEWGGRYHRNYGRFAPYVKAAYGRGVYNFVCPATSPTGPIPVVRRNAEDNRPVCANLAYNEFVGGAGTDFRLLPWLNLRADYEYQSWRGFPPHGLTPQLLTLGVAYHFPGGLAKGRHF